MTRNEMTEWIDKAISFARSVGLIDNEPNHDAIIAAVLAGTVRPDDNDGSITDETEALLFGALMSGNAEFWTAA